MYYNSQALSQTPNCDLESDHDFEWIGLKILTSTHSSKLHIRPNIMIDISCMQQGLELRVITI